MPICSARLGLRHTLGNAMARHALASSRRVVCASHLSHVSCAVMPSHHHARLAQRVRRGEALRDALVGCGCVMWSRDRAARF